MCGQTNQCTLKLIQYHNSSIYLFIYLFIIYLLFIYLFIYFLNNPHQERETKNTISINNKTTVCIKWPTEGIATYM